MAHGKALELRGIRSRVARSYWTKRHMGHDDHGRPTFETRQSARHSEIKGSTSASRMESVMFEPGDPPYWLDPRPCADLFGHPSPKSRARLRYEARRHYYGRRDHRR